LCCHLKQILPEEICCFFFHKRLGLVDVAAIVGEGEHQLLSTLVSKHNPVKHEN
jgi:hypothetical protein